MSKEGSEVAFIPDNISNISSGKEKFNEDPSQKIEDSYISKLTKLQTFQHGSQNLQVKAQTHLKFELRDDADPKQIAEVIGRKLALQNTRLDYVNTSSQKFIQSKFIIHKHINQQNETISLQAQSKRLYQQESENTYLHGKHTQTDVISQKESFVEQEHDIDNNHNFKKSQQNVVHFDSVHDSSKINKRKAHSGVKDYTEDLKETFYVTEVNKYDEFQTEIGWLEHCVRGNVKHLLRQTKSLLDYNNANLVEIEKVQLRTKIIELQIETNKLKIALRKSPSSKHINFSVDLKFKRPTNLKIPKKIDTDMRKYCSQLQHAVTELRKMYEDNEKELKLLEFYQNQFQKKVTYAFIYQEYLIQKAKQQLNNTPNIKTDYNLKASPRKNGTQVKNTYDLLNFTKKSTKKQKVLIKGSSPNLSKKFSQESQTEINQSTTSLAIRLKSKESKLNSMRFSKNNLKTPQNQDKYDGNGFLTINRSTQNFIHPTTSEYYKDVSNITGAHNPISSAHKKVSLTHHKDLSLPSNQKYIQISTTSIDNSFIPLFNTSNRQKKHFYYECQLYLKKLEKDYLSECESEKRNALLTNQNGFRQRELLRMKAHHMKNQILDTEVDIVMKEKEINKENQILKRELQLLYNDLFTKYQNNESIENTRKFNQTVRSPHKLKNILSDEYNLLYKQAESRLKNYKSTTMLESVRPNIPKSPKKVSTQQSLEKITFGKNNLQQKNKTPERFGIKMLQKDQKNYRIMSKSPVLVRLRKSSEKSNIFLHRFKTTLSQDFLDSTLKHRISQNSDKPNPELTALIEKLNDGILPKIQAESIKEEQYAA